MSQTIILAVITGGALTAIINGIFRAVELKMKRRAELEDKDEIKVDERLESIEKSLDTLREGLKYMMYDTIKRTGQDYIREKEVDFDDRRMLKNMHSVYHNGLLGNGDLDILMAEVDKLPLREI